MSHEIVVKGGSIVDGTGAEPFGGDLAIDDGRISAIGGKIADGRTVIDATGLIVSPGFVDIHTHLDAQIGWDQDLTPSNGTASPRRCSATAVSPSRRASPPTGSSWPG